MTSLHPITQTFPAPLEEEYRRHRVKIEKPIKTRVAIVISACTVIAISLVWFAFGIENIPTPSLVAQLALIFVVNATWIVARSKIFEEAYDGFGTAAFCLTALCFAVMLAYAPGNRVLLAAALFVGGVVSLGALPHVFKVHACATLCFVVSFTLSAIYRDAFSVPGFTSFVGVFAFCVVVVTVAWKNLDRSRRMEYLAHQEVDRERVWSDQLLTSIVPARFTAQLRHQRSTRGALVETHKNVAIVFVDIVGFTPLAAKLPATDLVRLLDELFRRFDAIVAESGAEKIKTIGDAYMAAAGLGETSRHPAEIAAEISLDIRECVKRFAFITGQDLSVRIGVHCGAVVAGLIGSSRFHFDLWGETVNVAARMESHGVPGQVQVSSAVAAILADRYALSSRGTICVKGVGDVETFVLESSLGRTNDDSGVLRTAA